MNIKRTWKRKSNIEALRILAAFMVINLHHNALANVAVGSGNYYALYYIEVCSISAVDIFVLISGYFLSQTGQRKLSNIVLLLMDVSVIRGCNYILNCIVFKRVDFSVRDLIGNVEPINWFITIYIALYVISPYINMGVSVMTQKEMKRFICILILVTLVWPTILEAYADVFGTGEVAWNINTVNRWGTSRGYDLVTFLVLYIIGTYIAKYRDEINILLSQVLVVVIVNSVLLVIWATNVNDGIFKAEISALSYSNPLVVLQAVLFLIIFVDFGAKLHKQSEHIKQDDFDTRITSNLMPCGGV